MKKIALYVTAFAATAGSAFAADLPSHKGPPILPPPPPPPLWTGFYVGLNAGGTWANSNTISTGVGNLQFCSPAQGCGGGFEVAAASAAGATGVIAANNGGGFIGGGQIGYNYQFYNSLLVGIEADIQGVASSGSAVSYATIAPVPGFAANSVSSVASVSRSIDYIGTVRGRLGWLATPTLLIYGTGGLAYGGVNSNTGIFQGLNGPSAGIATAWASAGAFSDTRVGWTAGGGVEWMFWPNWSAKVEYLYYDLGNVTYSGILADPILAPAPGQPATFFLNAWRTTTRFDGNIVRAGVNYHFNWGAPAPVVAKY
ncbi:outer membrane protein [Methylocystis sp. S23]|jgi:outer membrane immunogenic protein